MATTKQKKVAKLIIENLELDKPLTSGQMLEKVGYSKGIAESPSRVMQSEGVQEELKNYGFDSEIAKGVVAEILMAGENDSVKLKAADMIFKVHSTYAPEKSVNLNINTIGNEQALSAAEQAYLAQLDGTSGTAQST